MATIFIVEDNPVVQGELKQLLETYGYEVHMVKGFQDILEQVKTTAPDLVLLDLNLPGQDGILVCREIRSELSVPIIVLTSRTGEVDEVLCMNMGADDFVAKPYSSHVLMAHIEAVLRRSAAVGSDQVMECQGVSLNCNQMRVSHGQNAKQLTKNEFRILKLLMAHPGICVSRQDLMYELWSSDEFVDDNTLTVNVNRLRQTLAKIGVTDFLHTHRGQGYSAG